MGKFLEAKNDSQILKPVFIVYTDQPIGIEDRAKGWNLTWLSTERIVSS